MNGRKLRRGGTGPGGHFEGGQDMTKWKLRGQYMTLKEMQQPLFHNISILGGGEFSGNFSFLLEYKGNKDNSIP